MRKLMHHYQKHLPSDSDTDRIEWDLYRVIKGTEVSYEICGTLHYTASPTFAPTPENLSYVFETPVEALTNPSWGLLSITSYDKLTRMLVVEVMIPYPDLAEANQGYSEIIQRLVSK